VKVFDRYKEDQKHRDNLVGKLAQELESKREPSPTFKPNINEFSKVLVG
jgi:hypothetical protein